MDGGKLHVAMVSSPGVGHLIPVLLLANRLVSNHNVRVTILVVNTHTSSIVSQILPRPLALAHHLKIIEIPPPDISSQVDADAKVVTLLSVIMREARPTIRFNISAMDPPPKVLIVDLFGTEAWPIADEFGMAKYVFVPSNAWFVCLTAYVPVLDKLVKGQYLDLKQPINIPGCKPVRPEDVVDPMLDRNDQQYREYVRMGKEYALADGILMNTWDDLEHTTLNAMRNDEILGSVLKVPPIYPIGPLYRKSVEISTKSSDSDSDAAGNIMEWLKMQPAESVVFVSFGSGGTLSGEQMIELAWGLELSRQRFVWIVRPPNNEIRDGSFLTMADQLSGPAYLPQGFIGRTRQLGLVVPMWGPQVEILNHGSVGGFMSHCGWNSCVESIVSGVPMIAWPQYAEQRMNAAMVTEELKVGIRINQQLEKVVARDEIEKTVRILMEHDKQGNEMRQRVKELKLSGEKAIKDGTGSSYNSMSEMIKELHLHPHLTHHSKFISPS